MWYILGILFLILLIPSAYAANYKIDSIGITIEKSCLLSVHCTNYTEIKNLDNSPKTIGSLVKKGDDYYRIYTPKQNNPEWLRFGGPYLIVDPPGNIIPRIKMIHIVSQLEEFHGVGQYVVKEHNVTNDAKPTKSVRVYSSVRFVDEHCKEATISSRNLLYVLRDTIDFMRSGCDPHNTMIKTTFEDIKPLTKHDLSTSYKAKDQKWRDYIIKECLKSRNACTDLKQPTRGGL